MRNGAETLDYDLYTSVARNIVWGNGSGGTATVTLTGGTVNAGNRTLTRTIYGRIPAGQAVAMGTYRDTIVVTIVF
jgi:spore coat protein U-like protein